MKSTSIASPASVEFADADCAVADSGVRASPGSPRAGTAFVDGVAYACAQLTHGVDGVTQSQCAESGISSDVVYGCGAKASPEEWTNAFFAALRLWGCVHGRSPGP